MASHNKPRSISSKFLKVGSHVLQLELHGLKGQGHLASLSDPVDDCQLQQEAIALLSPVIKQHVADVSTRMPKKRKWRPPSSHPWEVDTHQKRHKASAPVVIKGTRVRLAYTFKACSSVYSVLQPTCSQKGGSWQGLMVLPQRLVVYYCPFKNSAVESASCSGYFSSMTSGNKQLLQGTLRNIVLKSGPKLSKAKGLMDKDSVHDGTRNKQVCEKTKSSHLNQKDSCYASKKEDITKYNKTTTVNSFLHQATLEAVDTKDTNQRDDFHGKALHDSKYSPCSKIDNRVPRTRSKGLEYDEVNLLPLKDRLKATQKRRVDFTPLPCDHQGVSNDVMAQGGVASSECQRDNADQETCNPMASMSSPGPEAVDGQETSQLTGAPWCLRNDASKGRTKSPIFGMNPGCRKIKLLESRTYSGGPRKAFKFKKPNLDTAATSQPIQSNIQASEANENHAAERLLQSAKPSANSSEPKPTESGHVGCSTEPTESSGLPGQLQSHSRSDEEYMDAGYDSGWDSVPHFLLDSAKSDAPGHGHDLITDEGEYTSCDVTSLRDQSISVQNCKVVIEPCDRYLKVNNIAPVSRNILRGTTAAKQANKILCEQKSAVDGTKARQTRQRTCTKKMQILQKVTADIPGKDSSKELKNLPRKRGRRRGVKKGEDEWSDQSSVCLTSQLSEDGDDSHLPSVSSIWNMSSSGSEKPSLEKEFTNKDEPTPPTQSTQQRSRPPYCEKSDSLDSNNAFETGKDCSRRRPLKASAPFDQSHTKLEGFLAKSRDKNKTAANSLLTNKRKKAPDISKLFSDSESDENSNIIGYAPTKKSKRSESHGLKEQSIRSIGDPKYSIRHKKQTRNHHTCDDFSKKTQFNCQLADTVQEVSDENDSQDINIPNCARVAEDYESDRHESFVGGPGSVVGHRESLDSEDSLIVVDKFTSQLQVMRAGLSGVSLCDLKQDQIEWLVTSNEEYLRQIFQGKTHCERHEDYKKGGHEKAMLKYRVPVGCFTEEQDDLIIRLLLEMFCKRHDKYADYVMRVILPEVCVKMAMDVFDVSHEEAEHRLTVAMEASQDEMSLSQAMEVLKSGGENGAECKQQ